MTFTRTALVAGPVGLFAYGMVRHAGKIAGNYGPGPYWVVAHLAALLSVVLLAAASLHLRGLAADRAATDTINAAANAATALTLLGSLATAAQFTIDLVAGFAAHDHAGMADLQHRVGAVPGMHITLYVLGPSVLYLGLVALTTLAWRAGALPARSPALVLAGVLLPAVTLNLLTVGALLLLAGLAPAYRRAAPRTLRMAARTRLSASSASESNGSS